MKNMVGMTLLVRDEIDIIRQWLEFHIPKVDFIVVTDNGSVDGTLEVLQEYRDKITIIKERDQDYRQNEWVDRMVNVCRIAGCSWVANSDADEFWNCDLRGITNVAANNVGSIAIKCRLFVPTVKDDFSIECPIERMKFYTDTGRNHKESECLSAWNKLIHRTHDFKSIELGNHQVSFKTGNYIMNILEVEHGRIHHYPNRSWQQYRSKYINGGEAYTRSKLNKAYGWHWRDKYDAYYAGGSVALKKLWYKELEDKFFRVNTDDQLWFVLTHYMVPDKRLRDWIEWNTDQIERIGARAIIVSDVIHSGLPEWAMCVKYPIELKRFGLSKTSNYGIRTAGSGIICKTDPDIIISKELIDGIANTKVGVASAPYYRNALTVQDAIESPRGCKLIDSSRGTIAMHYDDWCKVCGYDERMIGYGSEDGDLCDRCEREGIVIDRLEGRPAMHINHVKWGRIGGFNAVNREEIDMYRKSGDWCDGNWGIV